MKESSSVKPGRRQKFLFAMGTDIRAARGTIPLTDLRWNSLRILALLLSDAFGLGLAWQLARFLNRFYSPIPPQLVWWVWLGLPSLFWLFAGVTLLLFTHYGLYGGTVRARDYLRAAQLISCVYLISLVAAYFYDPKLDAPRSLFFSAWVSSVFLVLVTRLCTNGLLSILQGARSPTRVFLITKPNRMHRLSQTLERRSHYQVVGAAMVSTANTEPTFQRILAARPDEVLAEDVPDVELASGLYWRLRRANIPLRLLPSSREMLYRRGMPEIVAGLPTLMIETSVFQSIDYRLKRWLDYILATVAVLLLSPVFVCVSIAIRLTSPGPIFFRQDRMGLRGKVFKVWKFRTMARDAPQRQAQLEQQNQTADGIMFKLQEDPRVTPLGQFLRRTSLDELPQLFNVLLGQMSLVGPRPLPLRDVAQFDTWHHIRHQVLPGITGLWQVSGRSDIETFDDAARLDLHYIDNWSLNLDLEIMVATLRIVLTGLGAY
ncbi:sugar transferase [Leptothoe sp. PORK10 BA2]|uniref:sugar transferase n=1 Tax=Leptothoe sp. PORK10 BA2 TaxID=3110254 RepID=UPI002B1FD982|nr:sugar transferase [Leptothoe sp. PORK10 BA2]MEA5464692.1 sugar transferase [Leptothoe sp. PORK10 BA2]